VELGEIFGYDVAVVPKEQPLPLAQAIITFLDEKRRTRESTAKIIAQEFRPTAVERQFREIYRAIANSEQAA
jgi:glycosyltransferase involved in cell wall biosynthesis